MAQSTQLIVGNSSLRVRFRAVELVGADAEDVTGIRVVAGQTILTTRKDPGLGVCRTARACDEIVLCNSTRQQVSIRIVAAPFVGDTVHAAGVVENKKSSFEAFEQRGICIVDG